MQKFYTVIGLDFETGGLDPTRHGSTQVALEAIRLDTLETIDRYSAYIAPYDKQETGQKRKILKPRWELQLDFGSGERMEYEEKALSCSGITVEMLNRRGKNYLEVAKNIIDFAVRYTFSPRLKPVLSGQNILFDIGFLQQLMNYAGMVKEFEKTFSGCYDFYGNFQPHSIDTLQLARLAFAGDETFTSCKLEMIAAHLGISLENAHDAGADIEATIEILRQLSFRMRSRACGVETARRERQRDYFKI